jgi:hypothetical protein
VPVEMSYFLKILIDKGYMFIVSDLIDSYGNVGVDFLKTSKKFDNIITNAGFNLKEFTLHGLKSINNQMLFYVHWILYRNLKMRCSTVLNQNKCKNKFLVYFKKISIQKTMIK